MSVITFCLRTRMHVPWKMLFFRKSHRLPFPSLSPQCTSWFETSISTRNSSQSSSCCLCATLQPLLLPAPGQWVTSSQAWHGAAPRETVKSTLAQGVANPLAFPPPRQPALYISLFYYVSPLFICDPDPECVICYVCINISSTQNLDVLSFESQIGLLKINLTFLHWMSPTYIFYRLGTAKAHIY